MQLFLRELRGSRLMYILIAFAILTCTILFAQQFVGGSVAQAQFQPLEGSCDAAQGERPAICDDNGTGENPISGEGGILMTAANMIALATAVIAFIIIIIAGLTMTLSSGDSSKVQASRDAIIYAAVGLVVVGIARTLVIFVSGRLL